MGGEELVIMEGFTAEQGLPPRGRGRGPYAFEFPARIRITPAWAGKSIAKGLQTIVFRDYPRVGGEEMQILGVWLCPKGLPPRGRGRAIQARAPAPRLRITPAWAGKRA